MIRIVVLEHLSSTQALMHFYAFYLGENHAYRALVSIDPFDPTSYPNEINFTLFHATDNDQTVGEMLPVDQTEIEELVESLRDVRLVKIWEDRN